jgi:hypothetical protein
MPIGQPCDKPRATIRPIRSGARPGVTHSKSSLMATWVSSVAIRLNYGHPWITRTESSLKALGTLIRHAAGGSAALIRRNHCDPGAR